MSASCWEQDKIIGLSTHSPGQFDKASGLDLDYIAYGPIFPTRTKEYCIGTGDVRTVLERASKPVFFIGGINGSNLGELVACGGRNVALIRDIMQAEDVKARTAWYREILNKERDAQTFFGED